MDIFQKFQTMDATKDFAEVFTQEEQVDLFVMKNNLKIYYSILASQSPADLLMAYIRFRYTHNGDWGYACQIEPLFVGADSLSKDEKERLLSILYVAPTWMKHSQDEYLDLFIHQYFPPDRILFVQEYLVDAEIEVLEEELEELEELEEEIEEFGLEQFDDGVILGLQG